MHEKSSFSNPNASTFSRPVVVTIDAIDGRQETVQLLPVGPAGYQFEAVMGLDHAPVMPQRVLLPRPSSNWDIAFVMVVAAATEPAIPTIPFVQPTEWRRAEVAMPDFDGAEHAKVCVSIDSQSWLACLSGTERPAAQVLVPEGATRYMTVGWILAEMSSRLILQQPGFENRLAQHSQHLG